MQNFKFFHEYSKWEEEDEEKKRVFPLVVRNAAFQTVDVKLIFSF